MVKGGKLFIWQDSRGTWYNSQTTRLLLVLFPYYPKVLTLIVVKCIN